jgi:ADP-ribose pyrophosphatase
MSEAEDEGVKRGFRVRVECDRAELPNGMTVLLDVVRHPGAAAVVPFVSEDEVLLIRQYRHAVGDTIWEVPAGKLDGDTPEVCAAKELEEEVGRRPGHLELLASIYTSPGFTDEVIHLFAATQLTAVPQRLEEDEVIEVVPTPFDRALAMVFDGTIADAKSSLALLYAARRRGLLVGPG